MKIEKVNDSQICCTLSTEDLTLRNINISELAYGSEKARSLFREMLMKANRDFGFIADNMPLMIEAVPLAEDALMLLITKVEETDETDTRFSRFTPFDQEEDQNSGDWNSYSTQEPAAGADDIIEQLARLYEDLGEQDKNEDSSSKTADIKEAPDFFQIFRFLSVDDICAASKIVESVYDSINSLYKDELNSCFYLVIHKGELTPEAFNKVCNILSEYGTHIKGNAGSEALYLEHCSTMIRSHALQALKNI